MRVESLEGRMWFEDFGKFHWYVNDVNRKGGGWNTPLSQSVKYFLLFHFNILFYINRVFEQLAGDSEFSCC